jgi:hypothetical protein
MPAPEPINPADWSRWTLQAAPILAAARRDAGITARTVASRSTPARERREAVATIATAAEAEVRGQASLLTAHVVSPPRWEAATLDALAAHSLAAVLAWLDLGSPDDLLPGDGPGETAAGDREAAETLIARLAAAVSRLRERVESGDQLLDATFVSLAGDLAGVVGEIAAYVGLGREAEPVEGDMDRAAALWRKLAPEWARGLIDAGEAAE